MAKTNNPKAYDQDRGTYTVDTEGNNYKKVAASSTTRLSNTSGVLHAIVLNTNGGTVDIYDGLNDAGTSIGQIALDAPEGTFIYDIAYSTGLTVKTGATSNVTVVFRPAGGVVSSTSASSSASPSLSPSASTSPSSSASPSASTSPSTSPSLSPSSTPSPSLSPSKSLSPSESSSPSSSLSPSRSASPSKSPSVSISPSW